jgi:hypothetical protein
VGIHPAVVEMEIDEVRELAFSAQEAMFAASGDASNAQDLQAGYG